MKALAVALLLNGVQINLPSPALFLDGRAWVPVRPVAARLGWSVAGTGSYLKAVRRGQHVAVTEARRIDGRTYVPARWFRNLGAMVDYDAAARTLYIQAALSAVQTRATIGDITARPSEWANRAVEVAGEFLGPAANPLWDPLRAGPPVATADWVLRGEGGCIYCVGQRPFDFPASLGRRLRVVGTVQLSPGGVPFIRVASTEPATGHDALACCILTDAYRYRVGQPIGLRLLVRNDSSSPLELTFPSSQLYDFWLVDVGGKTVWQWSRGKVFLMAVTRRTLKPGQQQVFGETVNPRDVAGGLKPGVYFVFGELHGQVKSFKEKIEISAQ
ncbi:MAG: hypothetical protein H5T86_02130 [Armatimonadetes bacterium]|nr:hypothetical protein [Armatimonadota bacterium]